jgi:hypothetical protein
MPRQKEPEIKIKTRQIDLRSGCHHITRFHSFFSTSSYDALLTADVAIIQQITMKECVD